MSYLLIFHVSSMVLGFTMLMANATVCHVATRLADIRASAIMFRSVAPLPHLGRALVIGGLASGLYLARATGYSAAWLIASYILMLATIASGVVLLDPLQKRLLAASNDGAPRVPSTSNVALYAGLANGAMLAVMLWLMLAKPG